ncbi:Gfo/Idh/MocA family oxidoreductase [Candidatus Micrarchaeota archaeon]|nr:Gfo/Idh/MocA family oxidoreductase [Candidatus Micrarchaeota archaeon]
MAKAKLRVGIAGYGFIGSIHARAVASNDNVTLVAIAEPDRSKTESVGRINTFASFENLLDKKRIDALIIALPTAQHLECAAGAASRGIPVLLEKPMATTLADAHKIRDAFLGKTPLMVGMSGHYHPEFVGAAQVIRNGDLGRILSVEEVFQFGSAAFPLQYLDRKNFGRGITLTNGIHGLDRLDTLFGIDQVLDAIIMQRNFSTGADDESELTVRLRNGLNAKLGYLWASSDLFNAHFRVIGTDASLEVLPFRCCTLRDSDGDHVIYRHSSSDFASAHLPGISAELSDFIELVRHEREPRVTLVQAIRAQELVESAYEKSGFEPHSYTDPS